MTSPFSSLSVSHHRESLSFASSTSSSHQPKADNVQRIEDDTLRWSAWMNLLEDVPVLHEDLLYIVLNYLCVIGSHEAAEEFTKESGAVPEMPLHSVALRQQIYNAILDGQINEALEGLNQIDSLILELNPDTNFKLKQQQLNKIIEQRNDEAALLFAQRELAPCVNQHPHLLPQLEESMVKLAFPDLSAPAIGDLAAEREEIARSVDDSVLRFYGVAKESVLKSLLKYLIWTQTQILDATSDATDEMRIPPIPFLMSPTIGEFIIPLVSPPHTQEQ